MRSFLDEIFPDTWIGRYGPAVWPSRSPALSPLDGLFRRLVENQVYRPFMPVIMPFKWKLTNTTRNFSQAILDNAWINLKNRLHAVT